MSMLTPPWLQHELHVQFPSGSGDVNATYSNFSVMTSAGGDYVIAYDAFTSGAEDYLGGIQGNALDRRPSSCPLCQAWWWGAGSGGACHCDPSLMMMRVVGRVH
ncbi:hypothetical protein V1264_016614 [Littorina saxatilis]|uniref:Uncharacterized protein n=1 Tax=Littorina saxatilis TaxID=31220 RepID=A0AAN9BGU7_9CAEN